MNISNLYVLQGRGPLILLEDFVTEQAKRFCYDSYADMRAEGYDLIFPPFLFAENGNKRIANESVIDNYLIQKGVLHPNMDNLKDLVNREAMR